jgi:hypothetical protein
VVEEWSWIFPLDQAGAQHSLSPVDANRGGD